MKAKWTSNLALFLAALIWGFAFVAQVTAADTIGTFTMIGVRFTICIIFLLPVVLFFERGRTDKTERALTLKASLITGIVLFLALSLQQYGIQVTASAGISGFITALYMIFVPIVYLVLFKRKTGLQVWIGAVFALAGLFLLCYKPGAGISFGWGEVLLLLGAFCWTAHVMLIDHFGKKIRPLHYSWGQFAVCALTGMLCTLAFEEISVGVLLEAKWELLYLGVFSSGCAYTLQVVGQKHADPTYAVIILSTESAFSAIGGAIFGIDAISWIGYVGCALMFVGILCTQVNIKRKKKELL
jgi:drug/metabolite transporter (DMT)-like permease